MNRKLAVLAIVGCLSTAAVAGPEIWAPSPITIILQVGKWMWQEKEEVYYVQIRAKGRDEQDARDQAFRLAVEQATGSLMLSHTNIRDGDIKRHEIINYSSGFVHGFKIINRQYDQGHVTIDLDVWVRKSSIADRLLSESRDTNQIAGNQIAESYHSLVRERRQGDRVLASVLEDFPKRAFDIKIDAIRSQMESDRRLVLQVDYTVSWSQKYMQSLADAMTQVSQNREAGRGCFGSPYRCNLEHVAEIKFLPEGNNFFRDVRYLGYTDRNKVAILAAGTNGKNPMLRVTLHDGHGKIGYRGCFQMHELSNTDYSPARSFIRVREDRTIVDGVLSVATRSEFAVDPEKVQDTRQVDIKVTSQLECSQ